MNRKEQQLEKFRARWNKWLGQKTRADKEYWATLSNCNWTGWADKTLDKHGVDLPNLSIMAGRLQIKEYFAKAIECADMVDLCGLDMLYVNEKYGL